MKRATITAAVVLVATAAAACCVNKTYVTETYFAGTSDEYRFSATLLEFVPDGTQSYLYYEPETEREIDCTGAMNTKTHNLIRCIARIQCFILTAMMARVPLESDDASFLWGAMAVGIFGLIGWMPEEGRDE